MNPDQNMQQKILVFYYCAHTLSTFYNTGIQRVVRRLYKELSSSDHCEVVPIKWSHSYKRFEVARSEDLYSLSYQGPTFNKYCKQLGGKLITTDMVLLLTSQIGFIKHQARPVIIMPELHYHTSTDPNMGCQFFNEAKRISALTAVLFYDNIPLMIDKYKELASMHRHYLKSIHQADFIYPISTHSRNDLIDYFYHELRKSYSPSIEAIPLGVDGFTRPKITLDPQSYIDRQRHDLEQSLTFFCHGTIATHKNQLKFAQIFSKMFSGMEELPKPKLILAGACEPSLKQKLMRLTDQSECVIYLESPSDETISKYLYECNVFVFPSLEEGFGLPPYEALLAGKFVLCHNSGVMSEIASKHQDSCLPINMTSDIDIYDAITKLITNHMNNANSLAVDPEKARLLIPTWKTYCNELLDRLTSRIDELSRSNQFYGYKYPTRPSRTLTEYSQRILSFKSH